MICALVAVLMVAFASCGNKETKQYLNQKEAINELEALINESETCDELTLSAFGFLALEFDDNEYAEGEKMTAVEEAEMDALIEALGRKVEEKAEMLGCNNEEDPSEDSELMEDTFSVE